MSTVEGEGHIVLVDAAFRLQLPAGLPHGPPWVRPLPSPPPLCPGHRGERQLSSRRCYPHSPPGSGDCVCELLSGGRESDAAASWPGWHPACPGTHPAPLGGPAEGKTVSERESWTDTPGVHLCGGIVYRAVRGNMGGATGRDQVTGRLLWYSLQSGWFPRDL